MIDIVINGRERSVSEGLTLDKLLAHLELPAGRLAVERNGEVVPRARYAGVPVEPGDRFEVVTLVGGG